jgi:hypothetical protein
MLSRPFATTCYSAPSPGGGNLQVIVDFEPVVELTPDMLEQLRRPFQGLAEMGQWGGMAGEKYQPQHSTMVLVTDGVTVGPSTVRWDFNVMNVDPGTAFVIQNLVHNLHLFVAPVVSFVIRSPLVRDGAPVQEELPEDYEPYPFVVQDGRETSTVVVDVDFAVRQPPSAAEPFRDAWDGWYEVAAHGGFCSEDYPPEEVSIYVEDDLKVLSDGIGGVFDDVTIDDAGFYCLINMLQTLHHRLTPISEVTIE